MYCLVKILLESPFCRILLYMHTVALSMLPIPAFAALLALNLPLFIFFILNMAHHIHNSGKVLQFI